jgi:predicted nuclease of predicted toxin-antitoxin system
MKLLIDANLSPSLVKRLTDLFPGSLHVETVGLTSNDTAIWQFAATNDFVVLSKDSDFQERALVLGGPPKVVQIRLGNCRTNLVESLLRQRQEEIMEFAAIVTNPALANRAILAKARCRWGCFWYRVAGHRGRRAGGGW